MDLELKVISCHIWEFKGSLGYIRPFLKTEECLFSEAGHSVPWNGTQGGGSSWEDSID